MRKQKVHSHPGDRSVRPLEMAERQAVAFKKLEEVETLLRNAQQEYDSIESKLQRPGQALGLADTSALLQRQAEVFSSLKVLTESQGGRALVKLGGCASWRRLALPEGPQGGQVPCLCVRPTTLRTLCHQRGNRANSACCESASWRKICSEAPGPSKSAPPAGVIKVTLHTALKAL